MSRSDDLMQMLAELNPLPSPVADSWMGTPASATIVDRIVSVGPSPKRGWLTRRRGLVIALAVIAAIVAGASAQARVRSYVTQLLGSPSYYWGSGRPAGRSARAQVRAMFRTDRPDMTGYERATLGSIREVASFNTTRGHFAYYVAPVHTSRGAGYCELSIGPGQPGGDCTWQPLSRKISVLVNGDASAGVAIISGAMPAGIHEVVLRLRDGTTKPVPSGRGWLYTVVGIPVHGPRAPAAIIGLSKTGKVVTSMSIAGCFTGGSEGATCAPS